MKQVLTFLLLVPTLAWSQLLWGGLSSGMSPGEVSRVISTAREYVPSTKVAPGTRMTDGGETQLEGVSFKVRLSMLDEKLDEVLLISQEVSRDRSLNLFDQLSTALTAKYGAQTKNSRTPPVLAQAHWQSQAECDHPIRWTVDRV